MNSAYGLTEENLLRTLPAVLKKDKSTWALANAAAGVLAACPGDLKKLAVYAGIDDLPDDLLDILAYDFKVDWWDGDYTLEEKRRLLKGNWQVHRTLGTKAAVETAICAIYPGTKVAEWFEYNGEPYHFKLWIDVTEEDTSSERYRRVLERINFYKNLRSHLDKIIYIIRADDASEGHAATAFTGGYMRITTQVGGDIRPPHIPVERLSGAGLSSTYTKVQAWTAATGLNGPLDTPHDQRKGMPAASTAEDIPVQAEREDKARMPSHSKSEGD